MSHETNGTIHLIQDVEQVTDTFKKQVLVLAVDDGHKTQYLPIEFLNDKIELLQKFKHNDAVTVRFNIRGREWNGRFFCNLVGWFVRNTDAVQKEASEQMNKAAKNLRYLADAVDNAQGDGSDDELPF